LVDPYSCGNDFTTESKLQNEDYRLDDSKTKETIHAIIQSRRDYIRKVDEAVTAQAQRAKANQLQRENEEQQRRDAAAKLRNDAAQGDVAAQYQLAERYRIGDVYISRNATNAATWYRRAADQGHTEAQRRFVELYLSGVAVFPNVTEEVKWLRESADQGLGEAQYRLGERYRTGNGVPQNLPEAVAWLHKAAVQGHVAADRAKKLAVAETVDYSYSIAGTPQYNGDDSSLRMRIVAIRNTRFTQPNAIAIAFPDELDVTNVGLANQNRDIEFSINGRENDIRELAGNRSNWQVRVEFGRPIQNNDGTVSAEVLRITIVKN
jgi:hypothetical protein